MNKNRSGTAATLLLFLLLTLPVRGAGRVTLPGHVPAVVAGLAPIGRLPATNRLELLIGLPWRDSGALTNLIPRLYDPASTNFHRYLTPVQFVAQFGPTEANYQAVLQFARTNGFSVLRMHEDRKFVVVSAAVSDIEKAFRITLRTYRHPSESREFYAPDAEPTVDATVPILCIAGLNNYQLTRPYSHRQPSAKSPGQPELSGTGPGGNLRGKDFRNAYAPGVALNGAGQYVGLVELDGFFNNDITTYETQSGLPHVPLTIVPLPGSSGFPDHNTNAVAECSLDIEMVIAMAPGIAGLYVFEGNSMDEVLGSMTGYRQINQFSSSWGEPTFDATGDGYLQEMAAQGQTFFQASGDGDAYTQPIPGPSDDPYATSTGGTVLALSANGSNYVAEGVWNSGFQSPGWFGNGGYTLNGVAGGYWGSGGGVSTAYAIPGWQTGAGAAAAGGSASQRNIPDVALTGQNVWVNYYNGLVGSFEGTSIAAPLWAGFAALVNQQAQGQGAPPVGFLNPVLYSLGEGSRYKTCFHDVTNGNDTWPKSPSAFQALPGYDLCTGWGTPAGAGMINALAGFGGPVYVDFNYTGGSQNGSYNNPYKTMAGGVGAVSQDGAIIIKTAGSSAETPTITKPMTITVLAGPATIGN